MSLNWLEGTHAVFHAKKGLKLNNDANKTKLCAKLTKNYIYHFLLTFARLV